MEDFTHYTVMKKEAVSFFDFSKDALFVDATLGGGGHSEEILKNMTSGSHLISFDIDDDALSYSKERLKDYKNLTIVKDSYTNVKKVIHELGYEKITGGILFDLGASYHQLTKRERGFSFTKEADLDMRFDKDAEVSAYDVVNGYKEEDLVKIFFEYGEERYSRRIARKIVEKRAETPIKTTVELANIIKSSVPYSKGHIHPATRVFQAIRIEVNGELKNIKTTLNNLFDLLGENAIISVISFHSLEDRIVKETFKYYSKSCRCELSEPVCRCGGPLLKLLLKKPVVASEEEIKENPPSRSAKLRAAKYIK
ncbi:16S rRNA (cytosine(1402)-N(4))-methyltransferase RsmH [bacterium]|nr:16S rRNA (cytosine(1402)-N(4))-methyltransferase RsmH [bacterium]